MCKARRVNDQYHCHACGFQWDVDDEDRPMCKTGKGLIAGLFMLAMSSCGVAQADKLCDASDVAVQTTKILANIEACYDTSIRFGSSVASFTTACQTTVAASDRYVRGVDVLVKQGCTAYYNGPSTADRARLDWFSERFGELAK